MPLSTDRQFEPGSDAPGIKGAAVTPHDSTDDPAGPFRAVYVGSTGNVSVVNMDGTAVSYANCPTGFIIPQWVKRVNSTGTSASSLVGIL